MLGSVAATAVATVAHEFAKVDHTDSGPYYVGNNARDEK